MRPLAPGAGRSLGIAMHPILFHVGDFPVRSFGVMLMIGFLVSIWMASRRATRFGLKPTAVQDGAIWVILAGVLGARILFIAQEWSTYAGKPQEIFKLQMDGLTSFGGLVGGAIAIFVIAKRQGFKPTQFLDTVGVPMLVASAIGRVGCLLNGCCYGHACATSPPGVLVEGQPGFFYPAQLVDSALVLLGAGLITMLERGKTLASGVSVGLVLVAYGLARFIYEFLRAGTSSTTIGGSGITEGHVAAIALVVAGAIIAYRVSRTKGSLPNAS